ncbi:MAG: hypothetical protein COB61_004285 [Thiotrichales bacterium]|nr:hypothetical protein [Thiotrichales bacterium]
MADHRAEQIINAFVAIVTGLTATGNRVKRARVYNIGRTQVPSLSIYMGPDTPLDASDGQTNFRFIDTELTIAIVIHVKKIDAYEAELNEIRKQIHIAIMSDIHLGLPSFVVQTIWRGADTPELDGGSEKPTATQQLNWAVRYRHSFTDPSQ